MPRRAAKDESDKSTRQRVLRSSIELFAEKGFNGTGIRDLARAAGLTTSALYHYMSNKDDLLVEIMTCAIAPLQEASERILAEIADPAAALSAIVEHHVWVHATDRLPCIVTDTELRSLSGDHRERVLEIRDRYEGQWRRAVVAGTEAGLFHAESPGIASRALLQMATGVSHWFSPKGNIPLKRLCALYADGALGFLRSERTRGDLTLPPPDHYLP